MDPPGNTTTTPPSGAAAAAKARALAGQWAQQAGQAVQQWTVKKYTLPDKNVASQVLMYRQLLHTKCRPGLKLSREYQGTPAQKAVLHMPWWSKGIEETNIMEIAYDNLIRRLWLHGAILPAAPPNGQDVETLLNEDGMPPIPHEYWVSRLGFQQADPVTDFRSGGVLSLAMMVWIVESCPEVFRRFVRPTGDASVLPFGITSINITDMMSKFLMLSKAVDRMDALLSQKPFWRMFADPNALLACQELSMDLLADVVVELRTIRQEEAAVLAVKNKDEDGSDTDDNDASLPPAELVTVFDFAHILAVTEKRVEHDLLGAGPGTVTELRTIHQKLKTRYQQQLQLKVSKIRAAISDVVSAGGGSSSTTSATTATSNTSSDKKLNLNLGVAAAEAQKKAEALQQQVFQQASGLSVAASSFAGNVFNKIKAPGFNPLRPKGAGGDADGSGGNNNNNNNNIDNRNEAMIFTPEDMPATAATTATTATTTTATTTSESLDDGDWAGTDIPGATEQIGNFSIGDEDENNEDDQL